MSNQEIVTFQVPAEIGDMAIRVVNVDGEPWFVAADVAKALGYSHTPHMVRMVDGDEKGVHQTDTPGGMQSLTTISESGFYKLILRAEAIRPEVKAFQDWVTRIVLPSIRKTGGYVVGQERAQSPEELMRLMEAFAAKLVGPLVAALATVTTRIDDIEAKLQRPRPTACAYRPPSLSTAAFCRARGLVLTNNEKMALGRYAAGVTRAMGHVITRLDGRKRFPISCLEEAVRIATLERPAGYLN